MLAIPEDLGGNRHQLKLENGAKTNMHKVWDGQIIEYIESKIGEDGISHSSTRKN